MTPNDRWRKRVLGIEGVKDEPDVEVNLTNVYLFVFVPCVHSTFRRSGKLKKQKCPESNYKESRHGLYLDNVN